MPRALATMTAGCVWDSPKVVKASTFACRTAVTSSSSPSNDSGISTMLIWRCSTTSHKPVRKPIAYGSKRRTTTARSARRRPPPLGRYASPSGSVRTGVAKFLRLAQDASLRAGESWSGRLYALETVATEVPSASARVLTVTRATRSPSRTESF